VAEVRGAPVELEVPFTGEHHAVNTLAALGAYAALGLPLDRAGEGSPAIAFSRLRGEELELPGGALLINDAWNANPVSMRAALAYLVRRAAGRRAVAVLGEMAELGPDAPRYHAEVGDAAGELGVDVLIAVGGALAARYGGTRVGTPGEAAALLRDLLEPGDVVLVKASRVHRLETVAEALVGAPAA
jgi:UDP-N-acetylmuramoyl-tripeptide--D-alanyl-D-alanine ligase